MPVRGDATDEPDETFTLRLTAPRNADIDHGEAIGTILDDGMHAPPPLDCSAITASPSVLWPPDHKLRRISLVGLDETVAVRATAVTQDEPLDSHGDGSSRPDAVTGTAPDNVYVRAERAGTGDGRVYRIAFTATDTGGRTCHGTASVAVPHDARRNAVDSGHSGDSFGR